MIDRIAQGIGVGILVIVLACQAMHIHQKYWPWPRLMGPANMAGLSLEGTPTTTR